MNAFFIGLQFLTRISLVKQTEWSAENFGKSVKYFTLIGAVLGSLTALLAAVFYFVLPYYSIYPPHHLAALSLVIAGIALTGGLHCDGFMDTLDGVFSGRSRERMLEIMKDSRVGTNGIVGFVLLVLLKWSFLLEQTPEKILLAVFLAPIFGRLAMVLGITFFPYARPEGIGKAFALYANKKSFYIALLPALLCTMLAGAIGGIFPYIALPLSLIFAYLFLNYVARLLGGLTGDVYGAVTELVEAFVWMIFLF